MKHGLRTVCHAFCSDRVCVPRVYCGLVGWGRSPGGWQQDPTVYELLDTTLFCQPACIYELRYSLLSFRWG